MDLSIDDNKISWPGESTVKPPGFMIPTHLRVLTIEEVPFVFVRRVEDSSDCTGDEEPCPHYNTTDSGIKKVFYLFIYPICHPIKHSFILVHPNGHEDHPFGLCLFLRNKPHCFFIYFHSSDSNCDELLSRILYRLTKPVENKNELYSLPCPLTRWSVW